jgi:hypothetical protein
VAVVAALIMSAKGLSREAALDLLTSKVPGAAPNPGFLEQLGLWGDMGCQLDEGHPGYKRFLLDQVGRGPEMWLCGWSEGGCEDRGGSVGGWVGRGATGNMHVRHADQPADGGLGEQW